MFFALYYSVAKSSTSSYIQAQQQSHTVFMEKCAANVIGREDIFQSIKKVVTGESIHKVVLLSGNAGAGKSSIMARSAVHACKQANEGKISGGVVGKPWRVLYHFVGATPRFTHLPAFLQRLTSEGQRGQQKQHLSSDLDSLKLEAINLSSSDNTENLIVFIDAVNQMDWRDQKYRSKWLPETLGVHVRVFISTTIQSSLYKVIRGYSVKTEEILCGPLDIGHRKKIAEIMLLDSNKRLDLAKKRQRKFPLVEISMQRGAYTYQNSKSKEKD